MRTFAMQNSGRGVRFPPLRPFGRHILQLTHRAVAYWFARRICRSRSLYLQDTSYVMPTPSPPQSTKKGLRQERLQLFTALQASHQQRLATFQLCLACLRRTKRLFQWIHSTEARTVQHGFHTSVRHSAHSLPPYAVAKEGC